MSIWDDKKLQEAFTPPGKKFEDFIHYGDFSEREVLAARDIETGGRPSEIHKGDKLTLLNLPGGGAHLCKGIYIVVSDRPILGVDYEEIP
jgi:hypothetical protein